MCNALTQRFRAVIRYLRDNEYIYNESHLATKLEIGRSFLSDMKSGRKEITEQTVLKLGSLFPFISADWLLSGVGDMVLEVEDMAPASFREQISPPDSPPPSDVLIPGDAWEVIRLQASSLERKDSQVDRLLDIIEGQLEEVSARKKNNYTPGGAEDSGPESKNRAS